MTHDLKKRRMFIVLSILTVILILFLNFMSIQNNAQIKLLAGQSGDISIENAVQRNILLAVVRMVIAFVVLSLLAWVLNREILKRADSEQNLRMLNLNLEFLVKQRTADIVNALNEANHSKEKLEMQTARLKSLREIDLAILGSYDLYLPLKILLSEASSVIKFDAACIHLFDRNTRTFTYIAGDGFRTSNFYLPARAEQSPAFKAVQEMRMQYTTFTSDNTPIKDEDFVEAYTFPLISKGVVNGVIEFFFRQPFSFSADQFDFLNTLAGQASIAIVDNQLFKNLQGKNLELFQAYDETIEGWSSALEMRDFDTQGHSIRVAELTLDMAKRAGISGTKLSHIRRGALLHDIGKMGIPDRILRKPGPLTEEERKIMERHPVLAFNLLSPIDFLHPALDIPYCHHEKWDGTGYPRGLKGKQIPLAARLFAVVDVWDALRSDRPYRKAWRDEDILKHIRGLSGTHFDPQAVEHFFALLEDWMERDNLHRA